MNWKPFAIKAFLKASRHWKDDIRKLEKELDDMLVLPGMKNTSGIRSGNVSDMTAQMALRRLEITAQIEELKLNEEMLKFALKTLTEDERALIDGFFYPRKKIGVFVQEYGQEHGYGKNLVYAARDDALEKMRWAIEQEYYGGEEW